MLLFSGIYVFGSKVCAKVSVAHVSIWMIILKIKNPNTLISAVICIKIPVLSSVCHL